ncbi:hypothetical protein GCM10025868_38830 [Angustibacter aerolatus]|uniref:Cation/H+ exchanger transmembrane domain-containing protein n=1 Tax=Angustibacter aerolatus TaxID=1162965 RepID=A0ABQ6JKA0_9ACTN|nr:sodium:proton antiporter [Angustibacter aerolatus]GMA88633.1 hypothetical protein GCM10025868_38830 [Angustibacter aerolatus]
MHVALGLVAVVLTVVVFAGLANRFNVSAPLVLVVVGVIGAALPFVPEVRLEPEVVLVGLLPPLLYATAIRTSLVDFSANRSAILILSVGATTFTALVVGFVAVLVVPSPFSFAAGFALGAVVAPPDAVAATAVARRVGMPRRIVSILEGESLVNDATALVLLNTAGAAIITAEISGWEVGEDFARAAIGGVLAGALAALVISRVRRRVSDTAIDTTLSFVSPFAAYLIAEAPLVHGSGVLAVVVCGLLQSHNSHRLQSGAARLAESSNWRTVQFVLENAVFLLIGLQATYVVREARRDLSTGRLIWVCVAVLVVVLLSRVVYVAVTYLIRRSMSRLISDDWTWRSSLLVGWAGMRGVVTLAAAFALPQETPHRGTLLLVAFAVVIGTLGLQGATLPLVAKWVGLPGPDPAEDALAEAALLQEVAAAGQKRLTDEATDDDPDRIVEQAKAVEEAGRPGVGAAGSLARRVRAADRRLPAASPADAGGRAGGRHLGPRRRPLRRRGAARGHGQPRRRGVAARPHRAARRTQGRRAWPPPARSRGASTCSRRRRWCGR